jgi:hypothetical protein
MWCWVEWLSDSLESSENKKKRDMPARREERSGGILEVLEFGSGVSIYGIGKRRPEINGTAIVQLISPAQILQMHDR